jgi:hypothetical protein
MGSGYEGAFGHVIKTGTAQDVFHDLSGRVFDNSSSHISLLGDKIELSILWIVEGS